MTKTAPIKINSLIIREPIIIKLAITLSICASHTHSKFHVHHQRLSYRNNSS